MTCPHVIEAGYISIWERGKCNIHNYIHILSEMIECADYKDIMIVIWYNK